MSDGLPRDSDRHDTPCANLVAHAFERLVLERRQVVGGAAVTEEFTPEFPTNRFSDAMSLLHPEGIRRCS